MIGVRRLPLSVKPVVGESFVSYLDRLSSDLDVPLSSVLRAVGMLRGCKVFPADYGVSLRSDQLQDFAYAAGLCPTEIAMALLNRFEGSAFTSRSDGVGRRRAVKYSWAYFNGSHFCPACLSERPGAWRLDWKLPWSFACTRHGMLLLDICPMCGGRPGAGPAGRLNTPAPPSRVPQPGICSNARAATHAGVVAQRRPGELCKQVFASLVGEPLDHGGRLLEVQRQLDYVLVGHHVQIAGRTQTVREYFEDLRQLCLLILWGGEPEDLGELPSFASNAFGLHARTRERADRSRHGPHVGWTLRYATVPKSSALMAAILPTASEWLSVPSMDDLTRVLSPMAERARGRLPSANLCRILSLSSRLAGALEPGQSPSRTEEKARDAGDSIGFFGVFEASVVLAVERSRPARWLVENDQGRQSIAPPVARLKAGPVWTRSQIKAKLAELYQLDTNRVDDEGMWVWARERSLVAARRRGLDQSDVERLLAGMR